MHAAALWLWSWLWLALALALGWALKREGGGVVSRAGLPTTRHAAPSCHQAPVAPKEGETLTPKR